MKNEMNYDVNVNAFFFKMLGKQLTEIELLKRKLETKEIELLAKDELIKVINNRLETLSDMIHKNAELNLEIKSIITTHERLTKSPDISQDELINNFKRFLDLKNKIK